MDFQEGGEEFSAEDVETVVKNTIGDQLGNKAYVPKKVNEYCNNIIVSCGALYAVWDRKKDVCWMSRAGEGS